jgi:hypothetical protein
MGGLFGGPSIPAPQPAPEPDPAIAANQKKQEERLAAQEKAQQDRLQATKRARQTGGMRLLFSQQRENPALGIVPETLGSGGTNTTGGM